MTENAKPGNKHILNAKLQKSWKYKKEVSKTKTKQGKREAKLKKWCLGQACHKSSLNIIFIKKRAQGYNKILTLTV